MTDLAARNADILRRRLAGETLKDIGKAHGLSATRVRDILQRVVEHATTTEEEREAKRRAAKAEREAKKRAAYERHERERQEAERQRWLASFEGQIATIEPSWQSLNNLAWWMQEHEGWYRVGEPPHQAGWRPALTPEGRREIVYQPAFRAADQALAQWLDGRANETMTVLRLRRLTEV